MGLIHYSDSDSDGADHASPQEGNLKRSVSEQADQHGATKKVKKVLPKLGDSFRVAPKDDPTKHQGRVRSRPWVQGDYNAHVYLSIRPTKQLKFVLEQVIARVNEIVKQTTSQEDYQTHPLFIPNEPGSNPNTSLSPDLHVSLSHPLPLRAHQISAFHTHIERTLREKKNTPNSPLRGIRLGLNGGWRAYMNGVQNGPSGDQEREDISFTEEEPNKPIEEERSGNSLLTTLGKKGTGKRSRAFLALKVGAGHTELERIQKEILDPFLKLYHLPTYHADPEFHTSFAWSLLLESKVGAKDLSTPFTQDLLELLGKEFDERLRDALPRSGWEVESIHVKVGKIVKRYDLG